MDKVREHVYLAAMLHDIGKFYQRADTGSIGKSEFLSEHCKDEGSFCPLYNGKYSHKHVLWTAQFIEDNRSVFQKLANTDLNDLSNRDNIINLSACHHLSFDQLSELGKIIKEADCLSSGMDRNSTEALKDSQDEELNNWDSFKKKRMTSILETVSNSQISAKYHLPISKLNLTKDYFPKDSFSSDPDYKSLWKEFVHEFKFVQADTYRAFSETFLNLLLKYASCIPSSTVNFSDVSLYDHLKTTAALAVCLYDFQQSGEKSDSPFLLIGADFSGIQNYIYQIVSKYAGKNLKGRSFYLRLLSDTVVRFLLKELDLFQANIVYNSGGGFYLLAPNTENIKARLKNAVAVIEDKLFENHGTSLFVAIDSIELSKDALMHKNENLGDVWGKLFKKRDKKKAAKFAHKIEENYKSFFEPCNLELGENKLFQLDSITGEEFLKGEKVKSKGGLHLKEVNALQIDLGEKLRDFELIVVKEGEKLPYWENQFKVSPIGLGFTYYFLDDKDLAEKKELLKASADSVTVITINGKNGDCNFLRTSSDSNIINGYNNSYALEFYGGNELDRKDVPTFEQMCQNEGKFSRLGVLRMDVDNLGNIFQQGITKERATLSRYAALSRSFDFFFSGYLNTLWKETDPQRSFIVYSGGDDVFIVGSWDTTIELAKKINEDFKEFTCHNPAFSLSGGIAIINPKYPIMKGADESDSEEKNAKRHKCKDFEKNSLSFMGMALNWDLEFPKVEDLKNKLIGELKKGTPKSFLSKIMTHYANSSTKDRQIIKTHKIENLKTYWMLTYDLSRMKTRSNKELSEMIDNCINEVCSKRQTLNGQSVSTDYHLLELWTFAARWAELECRS